MTSLPITLLQGGEVYGPDYMGRRSLLLVGGTIARIGAIDPAGLRELPLEVEVVDVSGCVVTPGFIDPHVHMIGGGGEAGFASRTPELQLSGIVGSGITTVIGCLGTDGTTRHLTSLLAKARALEEEGLSAFIYTGNYQVPTLTITGTVRNDVIIVDKVLGAGEIAISDTRGSQPAVHEIARIVAETAAGGLLSGKAGVTHFHVGSGKRHLALLLQMLNEYDVLPEKVYATHITRSEALMDDAIALSQRGAYVDIDTADPGLWKWLKYYREHGGVAEQLTVSSDGNGSLPKEDEAGKITGIEVTTQRALYDQIVESIVEYGFALEDVLPHVTANTAKVLKLDRKGKLQEGMDADVLVMCNKTLELVHLFARGRQMVKNGKAIVKGTFE